MSETNREYLEKLIKEYRENLSDAETDLIDNNLYSKMIKFDDDTISEYINQEYENADEWEILKNNFSFSELDDLAKEQGIGMAVYDCFFNDVIKDISQDDIRAVAGLYALSWQDDFYINMLTKEQIASIPDLCKDENTYDADDLVADVLDDLVFQGLQNYVLNCNNVEMLMLIHNELGNEEELTLDEAKKLTLEELQQKVNADCIELVEDACWDNRDIYDVLKSVHDEMNQSNKKSSSIKM